MTPSFRTLIGILALTLTAPCTPAETAPIPIVCETVPKLVERIANRNSGAPAHQGALEVENGLRLWFYTVDPNGTSMDVNLPGFAEDTIRGVEKVYRDLPDHISILPDGRERKYYSFVFDKSDKRFVFEITTKGKSTRVTRRSSEPAYLFCK